MTHSEHSVEIHIKEFAIILFELLLLYVVVAGMKIVVVGNGETEEQKNNNKKMSSSNEWSTCTYTRRSGELDKTKKNS